MFSERLERAKVYMEAVAIYDVRDIEAAVSSFLSGSAPGVNLAFIPPAPVVAAETRRLMNLRLDTEARQRARQPALPPPDIEHTPEERARVKAKVDELVARTAEQHRTEQATQSRNQQLAKTNARFTPDMDPDAMAHRLRIGIGDPEGERDVA